MTLQEIKAMNPDIIIDDVRNNKFAQYGRVLEGFDLIGVLEYALKIVKIPECGNVYSASVKEIEDFPVIKNIQEEIYGQMPIQAGTCGGQNTLCSGFEYHQGSETIIAVTDCLLFLGKLQDMDGCTYDAAKAQAFYLSKGTAIEIYSTTLHYSPCKVMEEGFITLVILPKGTGLPLEGLESPVRRNRLLVQKNKFVMVHSSQTAKIETGVFPGLKGELFEVKFQ